MSAIHIAGKIMVLSGVLAMLAILWLGSEAATNAPTQNGRAMRGMILTFSTGVLVALIAVLIGALAPGVWTWTW
jgi:uncharacterized membrane protein